MAKITIKPSEMKVAASNVTNVSSAGIPIQTAIFLGRDISRAGAEIQKLRQETRLKEDKNRFYELTDEIGKDLDLRSSKFNNLSDLDIGCFIFISSGARSSETTALASVTS